MLTVVCQTIKRSCICTIAVIFLTAAAGIWLQTAQYAMSTDSCNACSRQIAAPQILNTQQKIVVNEPASQQRQWQVQTLAAQASQSGVLFDVCKTLWQDLRCCRHTAKSRCGNGS